MNLQSGIIVVNYKGKAFRIIFNCKNISTVANAKISIEEIKEPENSFFVKDNSSYSISSLETLVLKSVAMSVMFYANDLMYTVKDFIKHVADDNEELLNKTFLPGQTTSFINSIKNPSNIQSIKDTINMIRRNTR